MERQHNKSILWEFQSSRTSPTHNRQIATEDRSGQFHVTTDTTQKNKSSYAEYLVLVLHCTHITCHGFEGNIQIQLNNYEISPFEQPCEKLQFFTLKITL